MGLSDNLAVFVLILLVFHALKIACTFGVFYFFDLPFQSEQASSLACTQFVFVVSVCEILILNYVKTNSQRSAMRARV